MSYFSLDFGEWDSSPDDERLLNQCRVAGQLTTIRKSDSSALFVGLHLDLVHNGEAKLTGDSCLLHR